MEKKVRIRSRLGRTIDGKPIGPFRRGETPTLPEKVAKLLIDGGMAENFVPRNVADRETVALPPDRYQKKAPEVKAEPDPDALPADRYQKQTEPAALQNTQSAEPAKKSSGGKKGSARASSKAE